MTTPAPHELQTRSPGKAGWSGGVSGGLVAGLAVALTVMVLLPCFVPTTPVRYFESDPRVSLGIGQEDVLTDLGPAAVAWLQVITTAIAALGLMVAVGCGVKLSKWAVALAGLGMMAAAYHLTKGTARWEDWTQGGAWIAAAMTGLAAMHLAQIEAARRWIVGLCVAAAVPLLAEAGWYVWVEHPESVAFFETHRAELFAARGMTPGSEAAALYERRLRFADATGTFGLSNVLASVAAVWGMAGLGLLMSLGWRRASGAARWAWVAAGLATGSAWAVVWLTASKGAVVAAAMVAGLAVYLWVAKRFSVGAKEIPGVALGLVAIAVAAVLVRGAMGPPPAPVDGFVADVAIEGERSLLFRAHYFSAAVRIAADHPVLGSGSRGFADAYPAAKNPLNPESVTSTHSVLVDQITMLGVGGWAWSALLVGWLWRAGRGFAARPDEAEQDGLDKADSGVGAGVPRSAVWMSVAGAVVLFGVALVVRQASLYLDSAIVWLLAIAGFVAVAAVLGSTGMISARAQRVALLLAATVALVHNQVEMAFFQPASMGVLWLIVGAAGAGAGAAWPTRPSDTEAGAKDTPEKKAYGSLGMAGGFGLAVVIGMVIVAAGAGQHERAMAGAEAALRRGDGALTLSRLAEAQDAAGLDTRALRWRVQLYAIEPMPWLVEAGRVREAKARVEEALLWIDQAIAAEQRPTTVSRLRASLLERATQRWGDADTFAAAESAFAELAEKSPYNIRDRLAWADLAWAAGRREVARERYLAVLELREQKYLDPADPLRADEFARVRAVLDTPGE